MQGYAYRSPFDPMYHVAFVYVEIGNGREVLTRFHRPNITTEIFTPSRAVTGALECFRSAGRGVLVYLRDGAAGVPIMPVGGNAVSSEHERMSQWRDIGVGAQILRDLSIKSIRNLATSKRSFVGLEGFGIELLSTEQLES